MFKIFLRRSSLSDDAEQASRKMLSWSTAAARAGARELDQKVSLRLFGTCMSCTHRRHLTGGRSSAHWSAPREPLVRWRGCVHDMHVPNSLVDTHSSSPRAPHECVSTCTCSGCRCRPPKHFLRNLFGIVTKRRTSKEAQSEIEKLECGVNSNLASTPRNSLFWTSLASYLKIVGYHTATRCNTV